MGSLKELQNLGTSCTAMTRCERALPELGVVGRVRAGARWLTGTLGRMLSSEVENCGRELGFGKVKC